MRRLVERVTLTDAGAQIRLNLEGLAGLARAIRWRRMPEEGRYGSIRELAAAEGVDQAYVGRVLDLTLLAPDLVEAIRYGEARL